jgi:hypothetical protein
VQAEANPKHGGASTPPDGGKRPTISAIQSSRLSTNPSASTTPESSRSSPRSFSSNMFTSHAQRYIASELRVSPNRGHPNICKLLDFFEDREFYYSGSSSRSQRGMCADVQW